MSNGDPNKKKKTVKVGNWSVSGNERSRVIETTIEGLGLEGLSEDQLQWYENTMSKIKTECPNCSPDEIKEIYKRTYQTKTVVETQKMGYKSIGADDTMYPQTFKALLSLHGKSQYPSNRRQIGGGDFGADQNNPAFFHLYHNRAKVPLDKYGQQEIYSFEDYAHHMQDAWNTQYGIPNASGMVDGKRVYSSAKPAVFKNGKRVNGIVIEGKSYSLDSNALHKAHSMEKVLETKMTDATREYIIDKYGEAGEISRYQFWQAKAATSKSGTYHGYKLKETPQFPLEWRQEMKDKFKGEIAQYVKRRDENISDENIDIFIDILTGQDTGGKDGKSRVVTNPNLKKIQKAIMANPTLKSWVSNITGFLSGSSLTDTSIRSGSTKRTGYGPSTFTSGS